MGESGGVSVLRRPRLVQRTLLEDSSAPQDTHRRRRHKKGEPAEQIARVKEFWIDRATFPGLGGERTFPYICKTEEGANDVGLILKERRLSLWILFI